MEFKEKQPESEGCQMGSRISAAGRAQRSYADLYLTDELAELEKCIILNHHVANWELLDQPRHFNVVLQGFVVTLQ